MRRPLIRNVLTEFFAIAEALASRKFFMPALPKDLMSRRMIER